MSDLPELPAEIYRRLAGSDDLSAFYEREDVVAFLLDFGFEQSGYFTEGNWREPEAPVLSFPGGYELTMFPEKLTQALREAKAIACWDDIHVRALELAVIRHRGGPSEMPPDYEIGGNTDE